jgi:hypothetical protein
MGNRLVQPRRCNGLEYLPQSKPGFEVILVILVVMVLNIISLASPDPVPPQDPRLSRAALASLILAQNAMVQRTILRRSKLPSAPHARQLPGPRSLFPTVGTAAS